MNGWSDRSLRVALSCVVDAGEPAIAELVLTAGAGAAWDKVARGGFGEPLAQRAATVDLEAVIGSADRVGARFVVPGDDEWPERLSDLRFCESLQRRGGVPFGLWLRGPGHLAGLVERSVSIVGSRAATAYGCGVATDLAADLAEQGITVISGGAYGIDAAAHRGALSVSGPTVCVLAGGVDVSYPRGNARMFDWLAAEALVISELPPGATPTRVRFLARNRLIAALSLGTVVVEAALRSGARNTASWALGCGRQLMAVPGPVHSAMSVAPHLMIRNGQAGLVTNAAEVMELTAPVGQHLLPIEHGPRRVTDDLDATRLAVYEAVPARRRAGAEDIALVAGVSLPVALGQLAALEAAGLVEADDRGWRALVGTGDSAVAITAGEKNTSRVQIDNRS